MSSQIPKAEVFKRDAQGLVATAVERERALLAQLILPRDASRSEASDEDGNSSLHELAGLCEAAGALVVGQVTQQRPRQEAATLFGKGKVQEIKALCDDLKVDVLVVDCDLSPAQGRNLENALDVRVIDRT